MPGRINKRDQRPAVGVAHVVLYTDRMQDSARFMRTIGMRPVFDGPDVSVYEMRGGTHLILMHKDSIDGARRHSISWLTICMPPMIGFHLSGLLHRR